MKKVFCLIGVLGCTVAWSLVSAPRIGMVRCRDGAVYAVYGLHANFVFGERAFSLAQAASFSDQGGLVATDGRLELIGADGTVQASYFEGEASPVLSIETDASSAIGWLPRQGELLVWSGGQFTPIPVALADVKFAYGSLARTRQNFLSLRVTPASFKWSSRSRWNCNGHQRDSGCQRVSLLPAIVPPLSRSQWSGGAIAERRRPHAAHYPKRFELRADRGRLGPHRFGERAA